MAEKQLLISITKDGAVNAETLGMRGAECLDYIALLENLLEATVVSSDYTEDYDLAVERAATKQQTGVEEHEG